MPLEPAHRPLPGPRQIFADSGSLYLASALIGFIFAASGRVAIILAVGARGGLSEAVLSSWIFGAFFLNGLIALLFCTVYRQPLVFFWTIPGTVLVGPALGHLAWAEVIGAFLATGALMLALGRPCPAACRLNPSMSAHSGCPALPPCGIAPLRISTFCPPGARRRCGK